MTLLRKMGLAAVFAGLLGSSATAGLVPVYASVDAEGDDYRYTYGVTLSSKNYLQPGDSFVIYDFAGFVGGSSDQPMDFTFTTVGKTLDNGRTTPVDDPNIQNLVWTYTGATPLMGEQAIGDFSALSTKPEASVDTDFTSKTHVYDAKSDSLIAFDAITSTKGPAGGDDQPPPPPGVPEPSSLLLLAAGIPLALGVRHMTKRKQAAVMA